MSKQNIKPLGKNVIVFKELESVVGGIELSQGAQKNYTLTVVAKGPEVSSAIEVGDKIICISLNCHFFMGYAGMNRDMGVVAEDKIEAIIK